MTDALTIKSTATPTPRLISTQPGVTGITPLKRSSSPAGDPNPQAAAKSADFFKPPPGSGRDEPMSALARPLIRYGYGLVGQGSAGVDSSRRANHLTVRSLHLGWGQFRPSQKALGTVPVQHLQVRCRWDFC